ncbi:MAG TPA: DinB family protein, partial [Phycisphaerales bacterium]|nr:DinB family protein [Phycisphaerales bacterium]
AFRPESGVGRWPCRVLLGHLADAEILFSHRVRRVVGEERPMFAVWDEEAFIDSNMYGTPETGARYPVGAFVAVIHSQRLWIAQWLSTLTEQQWQRAGMHPERGPQSARRIMEYATWHLEHHAWYLNAKVARLH